MTKKIIVFTTILAIGAGAASVAVAGFGKETNAIDDRRASTEAAKASAEALKGLLEEAKKTNELLQKLIDATKSRR